jgi:hypothetical protein
MHFAFIQILGAADIWAKPLFSFSLLLNGITLTDYGI